MKKKRILGIVTAMLMVIALALTGCGQQGEQNAGATGSESRNEAISNENNPAGEVTAEPDVGKGVIKELRRHYPQSNIIAVDYDPGASEVNQLNRIKLMLSTAQKNLKNEKAPEQPRQMKKQKKASKAKTLQTA